MTLAGGFVCVCRIESCILGALYRYQYRFLFVRILLSGSREPGSFLYVRQKERSICYK